MAPKKTTKSTQKLAVKKPTAKKTVTKTVIKKSPAIELKPTVSAPAAQACACACGCKCKSVFKKLIVFLVIFALGFATCKYVCCGSHHYRMGMGMRGDMKMAGSNMFTNGCLDTNKIENPGFAAHVAKIAETADADSDGCVSPEEFKNADREGMRKMDGTGRIDGTGTIKNRR